MNISCQVCQQGSRKRGRRSASLTRRTDRGFDFGAAAYTQGAANKDVAWEGGGGEGEGGGGIRKEIDSLLALPAALCQVLARQRCRHAQVSERYAFGISLGS